MYPAGELAALARRKAHLQACIAVRRQLIVLSGRRVAAAVDQAEVWHRRFLRVAAFLPWLAQLTSGRRERGSLPRLALTWGPLLFRAYGSVKKFLSGHPRGSAAPAGKAATYAGRAE